ncbi:MAG: EscT/YscT/HrcT family type III secretion system export apparatus protein [Verrucomicrobia bacterium GWF2_51_19]|nr:MAG: EscT/YscT/HrcT family type III secretion system export apparatus protein [Verrucomicrobia bacterium GWF2_51_19]
MVDVEPIKFFMLAIALSVTRLTAVMTAMPVFGTEVFGGAIAKNVVMLALSMVLIPMILPNVPHELPFLTLFPLMIKEGLVGMIIGFLGGFLFYVVQGVGSIIDTQRGASIGSLIDPATGSEVSIFGDFLTKILITMFFVSSGFMGFLTIIYNSYTVWPVMSIFPNMDKAFLDYFLAFMNDFFELILSFGGPIVFTLFLAEFGLGMITRFAPQLNVFFLAMPIKSVLAVFFLILYMTFLTTFFQKHLPDSHKASFFISHFLSGSSLQE